MTDLDNTLDYLHGTLTERQTPETVVSYIHKLLPDIPWDRYVPAYAFSTGFSTLSTKWAHDTHTYSVLNKTAKRYGVEANLKAAPKGYDDLLERLGCPTTKRALNRHRRTLDRLQKKRDRLSEVQTIRHYSQVAKSRGACMIAREDLQDLPSACFIAYYTATLNRRSVFTSGSQTKAYDVLADLLFQKASKSPKPSWKAMAYVYPTVDVLTHLTDAELGNLLVFWFDMMKDLANRLRVISEKSDINLDRMIVRRGNDSTTWNALAGAYNKARDAWIEILYTLGMERVLDVFCPGKVLRLMAADVAYGLHQGEDHKDTEVWSSLPKPWEVFQGASCRIQDVRGTCFTYKVKEDSWVKPRAKGSLPKFTLTPELLHGVQVGYAALNTEKDCQLVTVLKKSGYFSGKG